MINDTLKTIDQFRCSMLTQILSGAVLNKSKAVLLMLSSLQQLLMQKTDLLEKVVD